MEDDINAIKSSLGSIESDITSMKSKLVNYESQATREEFRRVYLLQRLEVWVFFIVGILILLYLKDYSARSPAIVFLLAMVAVALVLFATGSQSAGAMENSNFKIWIGGGAAILSLIFSYFVVHFENEMRRVFRVNPAAYIIETKFCLKTDDICIGSGGSSMSPFVLGNRDFFNTIKTSTIDSDVSRGRTIAFSDRYTGGNETRNLVFSGEHIKYSVGSDGKYAIFDKRVGLSELYSIGCIEKSSCLLKVDNLSLDPTVERVITIVSIISAPINTQDGNDEKIIIKTIDDRANEGIVNTTVQFN